MSFVIYQTVYTMSPWKRGYSAALNSAMKGANPYDKQSPKYQEWLNGFAEGVADMEDGTAGLTLEDQIEKDLVNAQEWH